VVDRYSYTPELSTILYIGSDCYFLYKNSSINFWML
jgi:hypothetical protein